MKMLLFDAIDADILYNTVFTKNNAHHKMQHLILLYV